MKKYYFLLIIIIMIISFPAKSQNRWIEDSQMKFKIMVPSSYQAKDYWEGTDKIHMFLSSDQNVAVSVRAIPVSGNISITQLTQAFTQNIIKGANQLVSNPYTINGIAGQIIGYRWRYNNINVIVGAFYTIQNNIAFVVWTMIPETLFNKRNAESDAITNSFTLLNQNDLSQQQPQQPQQSQAQAQDGFRILISDDAGLEHLIPELATIRTSESGQTLWDLPVGNSGKNLTMVIQNITKQGKSFATFINEQITSIKNRGAAIKFQDFETINGLQCCKYRYDYNGSVFIYTAVDGPNSFYLTGFVGASEYAGQTDGFHKTVHNSFKKKGSGRQQPQPQTQQNVATPTAQASTPTHTSTTTSPPPPSKTVNGVKVTTIKTAKEINSATDISAIESFFIPSTERIHLVFNYQGNTNGQNFLVKWFSKTHNCLVVEENYLPKANGQNKVHSYIENSGKAWPLGDYRAEVWFSGQKLTEVYFIIGNRVVATPATNATLIGKIYADGKGDNQTKSLGGRYCTADLTKLNDNDIIEIRITSGTLKFVHVHLRNSSGIWISKYDGMNTRFTVKELITNQRNLYTHLVFNVNAKHEKYLPVACYADVWLISATATNSQTQQTQQTTQVPPPSTKGGAIKQIVMDNQNCGYDFATGKVRDGHKAPDPDVLNEPWNTPTPALGGNWARTGKSRMEDVTTAPAGGYISDGLSFIDCKEAPLNEVLVFKLKNGTYGKLMIIKDEKSTTSNSAQHRITCLVQYPAF